MQKNNYRTLCLSCGHKGRIHTKATRRKISAAHKGEKSHMYGKHLSKECRRKMSTTRKGKHRSEECRHNLSAAKKGKKNPNWKGGKSYGKYCSKFDFRFKNYIRDKFGRKCFLCGKTEAENGRCLSVHHVNGNKNCGCDEDSTCQFVPLCGSCHIKTHTNNELENVLVSKLSELISGWYI